MEQGPTLPSLPLLQGRRVDQVGIVVRDIDEAVTRFGRVWMPGEWRIYLYGPKTIPTITYRGRPGTYEVLLAMNGECPQIELLQPLSGQSVLGDWLEEHGESVHHFGMWVDALAPEVEAWTAAGFQVIQSGAGYGVDGDGAYAFIDTHSLLGAALELIHKPARRSAPHHVVNVQP